MQPYTWLYLNVPFGGINIVLVLESVTRGSLMFPLIQVRTKCVPEAYLLTMYNDD